MVTGIDPGFANNTKFNRPGTSSVLAVQSTETVTVGALTIETGPLTITAGGLDLNGTELILDANADTSLTADTNDQIDVKINGADDFRFTANTFTALSGSTIKTNTLAETTGSSGITIGNPLKLLTGTAAASASGLLIGGGTDANPNTTATADGKFIELRCSTTAASGDNRLFYGSYAINGAGGGECVRARTILGALTTGTAHGLHGGLTASSTGAITGLGAGVRGTLEVTDTALPANGSYYGGYFEIYSTGTTSSVSAATAAAPVFIGATGNATGAARVINAIDFTGATAADTTKMFTTKTLTTATIANCVGVAVTLNGVRHYLVAVPVAEWD